MSVTSTIEGFIANLEADGELEVRQEDGQLVFSRHGQTAGTWAISERALARAARVRDRDATAAFGSSRATGMQLVIEHVYASVDVQRDIGQMGGRWTFTSDD